MTNLLLDHHFGAALLMMLRALEEQRQRDAGQGEIAEEAEVVGVCQHCGLPLEAAVDCAEGFAMREDCIGAAGLEVCGESLKGVGCGGAAGGEVCAHVALVDLRAAHQIGGESGDADSTDAFGWWGIMRRV